MTLQQREDYFLRKNRLKNGLKIVKNVLLCNAVRWICILNYFLVEYNDFFYFVGSAIFRLGC